jgi:hypothetical protein
MQFQQVPPARELGCSIGEWIPVNVIICLLELNMNRPKVIPLGRNNCNFKLYFYGELNQLLQHWSRGGYASFVLF